MPRESAEGSGRDRPQPPGRGHQGDYESLLSAFGAERRTGAECVRYLESVGYTNRQARNAVYRYWQRHGFLRGRSDHAAGRAEG